MAQLADEIVGREGELRTIEAALADLERGRPVALEIEGEPGAGKTRLLAELGGAPADDLSHATMRIGSGPSRAPPPSTSTCSIPSSAIRRAVHSAAYASSRSSITP